MTTTPLRVCAITGTKYLAIWLLLDGTVQTTTITQTDYQNLQPNGTNLTSPALGCTFLSASNPQIWNYPDAMCQVGDVVQLPDNSYAVQTDMSQGGNELWLDPSVYTVTGTLPALTVVEPLPSGQTIANGILTTP